MLSSSQKLFISNKYSYEKSFYEFVKAAWCIIDSDEYMPAWHIECICAHMQALKERKIKVLDINIPFGFGKSLICSVLYPAWRWTTNPEIRFLTGSHNMDLAIRDTVKSRRLIESDWYQDKWSNVFQLATDQNTKSNYENTKFGYRIAFSTTGGTTGLRGDEIILDDALSQKQSESDVERNNVNDFLRKTLFSRQTITKETAIMGIGQRFHPDDYHSVLLTLSNCFHLVLPLEFDPSNCFSSPYYKDPRISANEPLWNMPKFNKDGIETLKLMLGSAQYQAQCQQRPTLAEGSIIKREWLKKRHIVSHTMTLPGKVILGWDCAAKTKEQNDFTVCLVVKKIDNKFYILDMYRKRVEFPQLKRDYVDIATKYSPNVVYVEDASNGTPLISELQTTKYRPTPIQVKGRDKIARVKPITPIIEAENLYLPDNAVWLETFIDECINFPVGTHDDIVDVISMILNAERQNYMPEIAFINYRR